ncbi:MAG TPA: hypothetical protein VGW37_13175 [Terriglobia bacterium]|nr:hypothetical protein [Terriglobia bacterium]
MNRLCVLLLLCCGVVSQGPATSETVEPPLLHLRVPGPIVRSKIPLTRALSEVATRLEGGYVLFGVQVRLTDGNEPSVNLDVPAETTLGAVLQDVLRQLPGYRLELVSQHLANIYPAGAKNDPNDALNLRIDRFDVSDRPPDVIMNLPAMFMPALAERLAQRKSGPPLPVEPPTEWLEGVGPKVTLHLHDLTVREILNRVSEASEELPAKYLPVGWVASLSPDPALATGWAYSFRLFTTVPSEWKPQKPEAESRTTDSAPAR